MHFSFLLLWLLVVELQEQAVLDAFKWPDLVLYADDIDSTAHAYVSLESWTLFYMDVLDNLYLASVAWSYS